MSVAEFEIVHDETIELFDENNENILLRMLRIGYPARTVLFDSKERIYLICRMNGQYPNIKDFYYLPTCGLFCKNCLVSLITNTMQFGKEKIIQHFYENLNEYWPTFGLSNFELK